MKTVAIQASLREDLGKKNADALRAQSHIPCVMYGGEENIHFHAHKNAFKELIFTADFKIAEVTIDGKAYQAIVKDLQDHPVTDEILHLDFVQLIPGKALKALIPVNFAGTSEGVKLGGKLVKRVRRVNVKCTPETLVEKLDVDVSDLGLGSSARVRDIVAVEGIQIANDPSIPVCTVEVPRALKSAAAGEEAEAEATDAPAE